MARRRSKSANQNQNQNAPRSSHSKHQAHKAAALEEEDEEKKEREPASPSSHSHRSHKDEDDGPSLTSRIVASPSPSTPPPKAKPRGVATIGSESQTANAATSSSVSPSRSRSPSKSYDTSDTADLLERIRNIASASKARNPEGFRHPSIQLLEKELNVPSSASKTDDLDAHYKNPTSGQTFMLTSTAVNVPKAYRVSD